MSLKPKGATRSSLPTVYITIIWRARQDSNLRPPDSKSDSTFERVFIDVIRHWFTSDETHSQSHFSTPKANMDQLTFTSTFWIHFCGLIDTLIDRHQTD